MNKTALLFETLFLQVECMGFHPHLPHRMPYILYDFEFLSECSLSATTGTLGTEFSNFPTEFSLNRNRNILSPSVQVKQTPVLLPGQVKPLPNTFL